MVSSWPGPAAAAISALAPAAPSATVPAKNPRRSIPPLFMRRPLSAFARRLVIARRLLDFGYACAVQCYAVDRTLRSYHRERPPAARRSHRRAPQGAQREHCRGGVLDRRTDRRGAPRRARGLGLFPRRRRRLYAPGETRAARRERGRVGQ